ncbi:hypothetical protein Tco_0097696 [Tanacetum coccineum]
MSSITAQQTKLDLELICPRVPGRDFDPLPSEEDTVSFLRELGHTREINSLNDVVVDQMHQPWRTFAALINRGLSGKTSGLDKLRLSRAQILWGMFYQKNVDYVELLWEDFIYQIENRVYKNEGTGDKPGVPDVTEDDSTKSESESWGNDEDDSNNDQDSSNEDSEQENESEEQASDSEQEEESKDDDQEEEEFVHTPSPINDKDDNLESESDDVNKTNEESDDVNKSESDDVIKGDKEIVQGEGTDAEIIDAQQGNENLETTQEQVVEDAHVTISTVTKKTEVPVTSSSRSSNLASKFPKFSDISHTDAKIVSPLDVHVHHEVPRTQAPTLLTIPVFVITESSPVYTNIPQSSQTFTPPPILTTPNPSLIIETTNPLSTLPYFASVFRFNDRITTLEKEIAELKKDPPHTQVTTLVDEHLDIRLGETREEFMNFLSESLTARIKEQVSSQPNSTYEAASTLTEFELKKILIDKMEKSESYLAAPEHRDCYDSLKISYDLDKDFFFCYDVYSLKRSHKDKDKDEDPSARSDRGLKKRKLSKDA